ncbi:MAG TPA: hypothetical protein PLI12_11295 [Acetobacteraceae bacterium]|nr:hypothetical protein [Acetobacteraceae bacterium]
MQPRLRRLRTPHLRNLFCLCVQFLLLLQFWIGSDNHLRPRHLVIPVMLAQLIVFIIAAQLPPVAALTFGATANLVIVAMAILPSAFTQIERS